MTAQAGDATLQHGFRALAFASLLRDRTYETLLRRTSHEAESFARLLIRNQTKERRLLELHRQGLLQGVVEYRLASAVVEVGQYDRVLVRQGTGEGLLRPVAESGQSYDKQ